MGFRLSPITGIRANATFLSFSKGYDVDDNHYQGRLRLKSGGAMIDVFPWGGGFFLSAGARINGNKGSVSATPSSARTVGGVTFTPAQIGTLSGDGETKRFAPQLTIGYSGKRRRGFFTGAEAGALFQGAVRVRNFRSSSNMIPAADLERERQEVQNDVDDYKVFPILQGTIGYRF
jgi:hypothetical protein